MACVPVEYNSCHAQNSGDSVGAVWPGGTPASVGLEEKALTSFDAALTSGKNMLVDSFHVFSLSRDRLRV